MPSTFHKIAAVTVGSGGASSIDFTSIPSTYTDLCLKVSSRLSSTDTPLFVYFNNDTTNTNYNVRRLLGSGSAASSAAFNAPYVIYADISTYTSNTFGNAEIYVPNYAESTNKSMSVDSVNENNATGAEAVLTAGLWSNTAAINRLTLVPNSISFVQYSTATLYGIKSS